ncbi:prolyl oligopeptidase family serine peptidase [Shewanella sp. JM162201]|uniref:Prolyl oligopeptidase family serine peptidase n=1 Tax=Shewanella jiangmenensis TaxID=2837387 RepID=A0ABS5V4S8_9GAMM|nr:prolyl oligopeptidase family serine peptidase [Shewanella jiangmenensis]MBT1445467.1 prolyl oligopeptidase family serine peptidase [Shewanella jiangmenensis]
MNKRILTLGAASLLAFNVAAESDDPFLWLEDVEGEKALAWVNQQNERSLKELKAVPGYNALVDNALDILNDKARIPYASRVGDHLYNFWKDEANPRGIYRRTTEAEYLKDSPKWETVLDIDALGKAEGVNWVFKGMDCQYPKNVRCLVSLSRGGADAVEVREFDLSTLKFIPASEQGFFLAEAKSSVSWIDENTVFVGTEFAEGSSWTDSGYPRVVKVWQRGTPLAKAKPVYEGNKASVAASGFVMWDDKTPLALVSEAETFYEASYRAWVDGKLIDLPLPKDAEIKGYFQGEVFIELKSELKVGETTFPQGAIVATKADALVAGKPDFRLFVKGDERSSISQVAFTRQAVLVNWLEDVKSKLVRYQKDANGNWTAQNIDFPSNGSISVVDSARDRDDLFVTYTSFLEPSTLYRVDAGSLKRDKLKAMPEQFDASRFEAKQFFATSKDGTQVPYFAVMAKDIKLDGKNPTLLYGYGGFEVSLRPTYSATTGKNWLEQGGVYVLANIRGGGEYGPRWHQAALKQNRHKAYEDFEAIAEDLIKRKITSPKHLGIQGGSNGGLLMGAAFTRRPDLYNAVICQVPLLDMKRFNKLLAGASWMGEYGNPDVPAEWEYIKTFSPYHNLKKDTRYPKVFFTTSTRDDRVHPGHARKMVAKMEDMGIEVLYFENMEGGHAGAADNKQTAELNSLAYAYLLKQLKP